MEQLNLEYYAGKKESDQKCSYKNEHEKQVGYRGVIFVQNDTEEMRKMYNYVCITQLSRRVMTTHQILGK